MLKKTLAAAFLSLSVASPLPAADAGALRVESFTLKNGMEVVVIPNHRVPAISHMVWFRVGSADDPTGKSGLAHFHEHAMFLGSSHYKNGDYSSIIARHGGQENAFTGYDATSYYINISRDQLPLAMDLESDRIRGITPADADITRERDVIIEERRQRTDNNPDALLFEQMNAALFRHHPYHMPVIGWKHEMEGLTRQDVIDFHKRWYTASNAILVVSGDITAAELKPLAEKYYGKLPKEPVPPRIWHDEPPQNSERQITLRHPNVKQPSWNRHYATASAVYGKKEQTLPLVVLSNIMGEGKLSRLYQALVVQQKIATDIDVDYNGFTLGPAEFEISVTPEKDVSMDVIEKAVDAEMQKILKDGVTDAEIERAKTLLKAESVYARDGLSGMARIMGTVRTLGLPNDYFTRWSDMIQAVTKDQILQAARESLKLNQSVTGLLLPELPEAK